MSPPEETSGDEVPEEPETDQAEELEELEDEELEEIEGLDLEDEEMGDLDEIKGLEDIEAPVEEIEGEIEEELEPTEEVLPEEEIIDERIYTVPLRKVYWSGSKRKRANRAVKEVKQFVERHMKPEFLLIEQEVNQKIWSRGIEKPPRKVRIRATKDAENLVRVYLAEG
ncbi:MAG: 50S ribosomal protein L31e [Candidatus Thorarchaeota archaeon]